MIKKIKSELDLKGDISILQLPGAVEGGTLGCLIFDSLSSSPTAFIKIYRDNKDTRLENEVNALKRLEKIDGFKSPKYIFHEKATSFSYVCQSVLPGNPLFIKNRKDKYCVKDFAFKVGLVTSWLKTMPRGSFTANQNNDRKKLKSNFFIDYGIDVFDVEYTMAIINKDTVIEHGDFVLHNILFDEGNINVIDWSDVSLDGSPLFDLYNFLLNTLFKNRRSSTIVDFVKVFKMGFFEENEISFLIKSSVYSYLKSFNIDINVAKYLLIAYLYQYSYKEELKIKNSYNDGFEPSYIHKLNSNKGRGLLSDLLEYTIQNHDKLIL